MMTLDIKKLHIIASEWDNAELLDRIYVVAYNPGGNYGDPMTCVVELNAGKVYHP